VQPVFVPRLVCIAFAGLLLAGCRSAVVNPWVTVPSARFAGKAFGDTATMRMSIVAIDTLRDVVVIDLATPAHLVVLDVIPGRSISPLNPELGSRTLLQGSGEHMIAAIDPATAEDRRAVAASEYRRCVDQAESVARQRSTKSRPPLKRDSTGRISQSSIDAQNEHDRQTGGVDAVTLRNCRTRADMTRSTIRSARKGEHYLVVFSSPTGYSGTDLAERIAGLSVTGSDVATTIEAIGAGLFVGRAAAWSGYYVSW
jgi:hypothetical protein